MNQQNTVIDKDLIDLDHFIHTNLQEADNNVHRFFTDIVMYDATMSGFSVKIKECYDVVSTMKYYGLDNASKLQKANLLFYSILILIKEYPSAFDNRMFNCTKRIFWT